MLADPLIITVVSVLSIVGGFSLVVAAFFALVGFNDLLAGSDFSVDIRAASAVWLSPLLFVIAQALLPPKRPAFLVTKCMAVGVALTIPAYFIYSWFFHYWA